MTCSFVHRYIYTPSIFSMSPFWCHELYIYDIYIFVNVCASLHWLTHDYTQDHRSKALVLAYPHTYTYTQVYILTQVYISMCTFNAFTYSSDSSFAGVQQPYPHTHLYVYICLHTSVNMSQHIYHYNQDHRLLPFILLQLYVHTHTYTHIKGS